MIRKSLLIFSFMFCMQSNTVKAHHPIIDCLEGFAYIAQGLRDLTLSIKLLSSMTQDEFDATVDNTNATIFELIVPAAAAGYGAYKFGVEPYQTNSNAIRYVAQGITAATASALITYLVCSIPKEIIDNLLKKIRSSKRAIRNSINPQATALSK